MQQTAHRTRAWTSSATFCKLSRSHRPANIRASQMQQCTDTRGAQWCRKDGSGHTAYGVDAQPSACIAPVSPKPVQVVSQVAASTEPQNSCKSSTSSVVLCSVGKLAQPNALLQTSVETASECAYYLTERHAERLFHMANSQPAAPLSVQKKDMCASCACMRPSTHSVNTKPQRIQVFNVGVSAA
jgi:hypothetical protein